MIIFFSGESSTISWPEAALDNSNIMITYYRVHLNDGNAKRRIATVKQQRDTKKAKKDANRRKTRSRLKS